MTQQIKIRTVVLIIELCSISLVRRVIKIRLDVERISLLILACEMHITVLKTAVGIFRTEPLAQQLYTCRFN